MSKVEQIRFVSDLGNNVLKQIMDDILNGKVPDNWDGIELRQLLADRFAAANYVKMDKSRKRSYKNTCLINDL